MQDPTSPIGMASEGGSEDSMLLSIGITDPPKPTMRTRPSGTEGACPGTGGGVSKHSCGRIQTSPNQSMQDHLDNINVRPDCRRQQLYSCVANGKLYNEEDIGVLASVLKGVDITEV